MRYDFEWKEVSLTCLALGGFPELSITLRFLALLPGVFGGMRMDYFCQEARMDFKFNKPKNGNRRPASNTAAWFLRGAVPRIHSEPSRLHRPESATATEGCARLRHGLGGEGRPKGHHVLCEPCDTSHAVGPPGVREVRKLKDSKLPLQGAGN
jgi:hypothetical protein